MIADFVLDRMTSYIAGGMKPATAAHFCKGELLAIYRRQHHSRNKSGAMELTPLPENIATTAAMAKCDNALNEILKACTDMEKEKAMNTEKRNAPKAPDHPLPAMPETEKRSGLEGLKNYAKRKPA